MTVYYVIMGIFLIPAALILIGMIVALIDHRRQPLEKRMNQARQDLLKKESETGASELYSGAYSKVSDEMLRDMAKEEGFHFVDLTSRTISFQRTITQDSNMGTTPLVKGAPIHARGDLGNKRHRERLHRHLTEAPTGEASLTLRRDELGALPKAEILHTAQEHGWAYRTEEISGNEWRLLFHRDGQAAETSQGVTG